MTQKVRRTHRHPVTPTHSPKTSQPDTLTHGRNTHKPNKDSTRTQPTPGHPDRPEWEVKVHLYVRVPLESVYLVIRGNICSPLSSVRDISGSVKWNLSETLYLPQWRRDGTRHRVETQPSPHTLSPLLPRVKNNLLRGLNLEGKTSRNPGT